VLNAGQISARPYHSLYGNSTSTVLGLSMLSKEYAQPGMAGLEERARTYEIRERDHPNYNGAILELSCQTRHITLEYSHSIRRASNTSWNIQRHASDKKGVSSLFLTLFAKLLEIEELAYHAKSAEESHGIFLSPQTLVRVRSHEMTELPIGIPQPLSMTSCSARSSSPPLSGVCQIGKLSQPG
jgi:hypothetical protein